MYITLVTVLSSDYLTCHYLARPLCGTMTYPDYHLSPDLTSYLIHITTCHAIFYTKHDTPDLVIIMFTGILSCLWN